MMTNTRIKLAGITIMLMLLIPGTSFSEVVFEVLKPISEGLYSPEDVAVSPDGKVVYIVDGSKGQILKYDTNGKPAGSISILNPTSVAVGSKGKIYVGTNNDLSVKIFDSSLKNIIGSLGSGAGEFKLPRNITIDNVTGNVYVVDQLDHSIKVYTSAGAFISKINDYPNLPQDAAIINNKIYVIDHPLIIDNLDDSDNPGTIRGAEIAVFDMAGKPIMNFGSYGTEEGQFIRPEGITSDAKGILCITDSFHGVAMFFDANGSYLGAIPNPLEPMVTPTGIALLVGKGELFIASPYTSSIRIFDFKLK